MAGLVFLLVFWALAGACQRHGVGVFFIVKFFFFFLANGRTVEDANGRPIYSVLAVILRRVLRRIAGLVFPFGFLGAGGRLPKERHGRFFNRVILLLLTRCWRCLATGYWHGSGRWRAHAKGTAWAGFCCVILLLLLATGTVPGGGYNSSSSK